MKRTALTLELTIAIFVLLVAGTQMVNLVEANAYPYPWPSDFPTSHSPYFIVQSPQDRVYYNTEPILLNFTLKANYELKSSALFFYGLDVQKDYRLESVEVEEVHEFVLYEGYYHVGYEGHVFFSNLSDGPHTLLVFYGYIDSDGVITEAYSSVKVNFRIEPEPFPTTLVATASGFSVAAISLGLLVYYKKRKHRSLN